MSGSELAETLAVDLEPDDARAEGMQPVVAAIPGHDRSLLGPSERRPVAAGELARGVDRVGAPAGQEDLAVLDRRERRDTLGEIERRPRRELLEGVVRLERRHLACDRLGDLAPAVTHVAVPEPRGRVEVAPTVLVPEIGAFTARDDHLSVLDGGHVGLGVPERGLGHGAQRRLAGSMVLRAGSVLVVALVLAACGGAGSTEPSSTGAQTSAATTEPPAAAVAPAEGAAPWPAPPNPLELTVDAGLVPERKETLVYHVHAHLDVFVNGELVQIPAGIGIDTANPGVQSGEAFGGPAYGGIRECDEPCISPLHTHDVTGVLHTESLSQVPNRLGQFFVQWGVRLDEQCVGGYCEPEAPIAVYVDGEPYEGNPADISLTDRKEIAVVIGTPPAVIPPNFDFAGKA